MRAVSFVDMDQRAYTIHHTECLSRQNRSLIRRKNPVKFENDCISRNGRRIKSTEPNLMILVSFSSAEDALSNDVKNIPLLECKVLKINRFWGTPGIYIYIYCDRIGFNLWQNVLVRIEKYIE